MIASFRHIATGRPARELRRMQRVGAHFAQIGALFTLLIFFADTINADILYAAIIGDIRFDDNPLILDSASDSTSVIPEVLQPHVNYFAAAKYDGGVSNVHKHAKSRFFGTTIIEDEDSPAVLDGESTANLTYDLQSYYTQAKIDSESAVTTLDRTITYARLLI